MSTSLPDDTISVPEAAERLGVSERTIRRRIKDGEIRATSMETPQGHTWRIDPASLPNPSDTPPGTADRQPADATRHDEQENSADRHVQDATRQVNDAAWQASDTPPGTAGTSELVKLLEDERRDRAALVQRNEQLAGQVGFLQAKLQDAESTIQRLLMAPKDEPVLPIGNTPPAEPEPEQRRSWWQRLTRRT